MRKRRKSSRQGERKGVVKTKERREGRKSQEEGKESKARWKWRQRVGHPHGLSLQESKGYDFESETDTESIVKLVKYMYDNRDSDDISFSTLVERVIQQLVMWGAQRGSWVWVQWDTHTTIPKSNPCTPVLPECCSTGLCRCCRMLWGTC